jgi:hypothetical protein
MLLPWHDHAAPPRGRAHGGSAASRRDIQIFNTMAQVMLIIRILSTNQFAP